jgi:DNA-binding beta-propeller fold protein YncE
VPYVASKVSDAVAVFRRDATTGALTQPLGTAGCVSQTGTGGQCVDGRALNGASAVVVSPDGANVYVASGTSDAIASFARNTTSGQLAQLADWNACISQGGIEGCATGKASTRSSRWRSAPTERASTPRRG